MSFDTSGSASAGASGLFLALRCDHKNKIDHNTRMRNNITAYGMMQQRILKVAAKAIVRLK